MTTAKGTAEQIAEAMETAKSGTTVKARTGDAITTEVALEKALDEGRRTGPPLYYEDALGSDKRVFIAIVTTRPMPLKWKDPSDPEGKVQIFPPLVTQEPSAGMVIAEVPLMFAQRLIAAEPYKYKLLKPGKIMVEIGTRSGGKQWVECLASKPIMNGSKVMTADNGNAMYEDPNEWSKPPAPPVPTAERVPYRPTEDQIRTYPNLRK